MYHQNTFMIPVENPDSCKIMMGYYHVQENQQEIQGVEELKTLGSLPLKTRGTWLSNLDGCAGGGGQKSMGRPCWLVGFGIFRVGKKGDQVNFFWHVGVFLFGCIF